MCPFIYNILPETLSVKLLFRTLWIVSNFNTSIAAISNLRKVSLCIGEDIPRCMKVILNSNLWWDSNFLYFIPQIASIQRFLFFASSFLMAFVIPLQKITISLNCQFYRYLTFWSLKVSLLKTLNLPIQWRLMITCAKTLSTFPILK